MLLAIDTATRLASIALYHRDGIVAEMAWRSRENHTVELMAQIVHLLDLCRLTKNDLRAIGVALGPGSFTGLRVGMSVAKGLAFGLHIPILGVPTLDAIALPHAWNALPIWAILAAGRGRFSVARYVAEAGTVRRVSDYALVNAESLITLVAREMNDVSSRAIFCGDVETTLAQHLTDHWGARAIIPSFALNTRRAAFMAELAWARWQRGEADDATTLAPMYLPHESVEGVR